MSQEKAHVALDFTYHTPREKKVICQAALDLQAGVLICDSGIMYYPPGADAAQIIKDLTRSTMIQIFPRA